MKLCSICNITKPLSDFAPNKQCKQGVRPNCKSCGVIEANVYRKKIQNMWKLGELSRPKTKKCPSCKMEKDASEFTQTINNVSGLEGYCKACNKIKAHEIRVECFESRLLSTVKLRARRNRLPFNLTIEDIVIPEKRPILGITLSKNNRAFLDSSPSMDRIIPSKGYTKGNIVIISNRANVIKRDATVHELVSLADFYSKLIGAGHD